MAGSLNDIFTVIQNGVVAVNNLAQQIAGTFNRITLQTAYGEQTAYTSGTSSMAGAADTIPQITDGTLLLQVSITPRLSTSQLLVRATITATNGTPSNMWAAIFKDNITSAIGSVGIGVANGDAMVPTSFTVQTTSGTTSPINFTLHIGLFNGGAGSWIVNGVSAARRLGGSQRTTMTIEEIKT